MSRKVPRMKAWVKALLRRRLTPFPTAYLDGLDYLYHWQRFDESRLRATLINRTVYCADPTTFNDPWDCKPNFYTQGIKRPRVRSRHVQWAIDTAKRAGQMSQEDIDRMADRLHRDPELLLRIVDQISRKLGEVIGYRYRVYCLGCDSSDALMWSYYAEGHTGICLEFSTHNDVMCAPLRVQYRKKFPNRPVYAKSEADSLAILLTKSHIWKHEREYRLVAQERSRAVPADTPMTDSNLLTYPEGALVSVIVGCQGEYGAVKKVVDDVSPELTVKQAMRVPDRFDLRID